MKRIVVHSAWSVVISLWMLPTFAIEPLPEGDTGIAARYPGDQLIASDSNVLFFQTTLSRMATPMA